MRSGDGDLEPLPVHVPVLNAEHLALAATCLQGADDAVVHRRARPLVLLRVDRQRRVEQRPFFVRSHAPVALRFLLCPDADAEPVER